MFLFIFFLFFFLTFFFFSFFLLSLHLCSLSVLYWWHVLSYFGSYSDCFLFKVESLTLSCCYISSIYNEYDNTYVFNFNCQAPTLQTASWHRINIFQGSQHCLGGSMGKLGIQWKLVHVYSTRSERYTFLRNHTLDLTYLGNKINSEFSVKMCLCFIKKKMKMKKSSDLCQILVNFWLTAVENQEGFQPVFLKSYLGNKKHRGHCFQEAFACASFCLGLPVVQVSCLLIWPGVRRMENQPICKFMLPR